MLTIVNNQMYKNIKQYQIESIIKENIRNQENSNSPAAEQSNFTSAFKSLSNNTTADPISKNKYTLSSLPTKVANYFVRTLKSVYNLFRSALPGSSSTNYRFERQAPILASNKEMRLLVTHELSRLNIAEQGMKDEKFANQTIDAILSAVYSEQKDAFCMNQISMGNKIPQAYLREIGEIAKQNGLAGKESDTIFTPAGAGANPFLTALVSPVEKKFCQRIRSREQDAKIKDYAKRKIYGEVEKICAAKDRIGPNEFNAKLDDIAQKYAA